MDGRWLINLGWVDELPLDDAQRRQSARRPGQPGVGSGRPVLLPWQTGLGGIAYNLEATGRELTSTNDLFDPEFNGRIGMLLEMRDTMGLILPSLGVDISAISSFSEAEEAFAKLEQAKADGQIRAFTGNDYWPTWSRGTSPPASAGPATSPSCRSTTRTSASSSPRRGARAGPTRC